MKRNSLTSGRLVGYLGIVGFLGVSSIAANAVFAASSGDGLDGVQADPVALLDLVRQNAARLSELSVTTVTTLPNRSRTASTEKHFRIQFQQNREQITVGNSSWDIDVESGSVAIANGRRHDQVPITELSTDQPPSLMSFVPLSPSLFFPQQVYAGYSFTVTSSSHQDGSEAVVLSGQVAAAPGAGRVELVVDPVRGLLIAERFFTSAGRLVREVSYRDYQNIGSSFLPSRVEERHISSRREELVVTSATNMRATALGQASSVGGVR